MPAISGTLLIIMRDFCNKKPSTKKTKKKGVVHLLLHKSGAVKCAQIDVMTKGGTESGRNYSCWNLLLYSHFFIIIIIVLRILILRTKGNYVLRGKSGKIHFPFLLWQRGRKWKEFEVLKSRRDERKKESNEEEEASHLEVMFLHGTRRCFQNRRKLPQDHHLPSRKRTSFQNKGKKEGKMISSPFLYILSLNKM